MKIWTGEQIAYLLENYHKISIPNITKGLPFTEIEVLEKILNIQRLMRNKK